MLEMLDWREVEIVLLIEMKLTLLTKWKTLYMSEVIYDLREF